MRVLLVDDDLDFRTILGEVLADEGVDVVAAANGHEAMAEIDRASPDVILLDQAMPSMGGPALLHLIRATPASEHIPVVMMSASRSLPSTLELANGYLAKPFEIEDVVTLLWSRSRPSDSRSGARDRHRHHSPGAQRPCAPIAATTSGSSSVISWGLPWMDVYRRRSEYSTSGRRPSSGWSVPCSSPWPA
jgi:CheY-like chemotaxis protein